MGKEHLRIPSKGVVRCRETKANIANGAEATLFGGRKKS